MLQNFLLALASAMAESETGAAVADTLATEGAQTDPNAASPVASLLGMFIPMVLMIAIFYFLLIRPQRKKDKKVKDMLANLKKGDRVTTIGGIYGTILNIKDETITLAVGQTGEKPTEMTVARWAIRGVEEVSVENDGEILA